MTPMPAGIRLFDDGKQLALWCPGCRHIHHVPVDGSRGWKWDQETLTLQPSVRHFYSPQAEAVQHSMGEVTTCHYFVQNGQINLLDDSSGHALRGVHPLDEEPPQAYGGREHFGWGPGEGDTP